MLLITLKLKWELLRPRRHSLYKFRKNRLKHFRDMRVAKTIYADRQTDICFPVV